MTKLALVFGLGAVAALGACAQQQQTTSLAKLAPSNIEVVARGQVNIEMHVNETGGCPLLGDDVQATFDGQPMQVARGGYDTDSSGCWPIAFWFDKPPMNSINGFERDTNSSQLVVKDASAAWSVNTSRLFANDFVIDAVNSQIIWTDVAQITSASIAPATHYEIHGNAIVYTPGATIEWVDALAHPVPTLCDGPAVCTVNLEGARDWTITNP
jgi:hypothetical protein